MLRATRAWYWSKLDRPPGRQGTVNRTTPADWLSGAWQSVSLTTPYLQHRTKPVETLYINTYFCQSPWQKCLLSQIKRLFSPSAIAMLFAVTQEMHAWVVKPKHHRTRGGEGGEFVLDTMVAWCDIENCIEISQQFCPGLSFDVYWSFSPLRQLLQLVEFHKLDQ